MKKETVKKEYVTFSITGEFVTKTARDWLYAEKRPYKKVLDFLLACMCGTDLDNETLVKLANDILTGKKKMEGTTRDDSYCMVDDDTDIIKKYPLAFENLSLPEKTEIEEDEESPVEPIRKREKLIRNITTKTDYGWLSPEGKFFEVGWGSHEKWAYEYISDNHPEWDNETSPFRNSGDVLVKHGWLLLHNPGMGDVILRKHDVDNATQRQKNFLFDYFMERDAPEIASSFFGEAI